MRIQNAPESIVELVARSAERSGGSLAISSKVSGPFCSLTYAQLRDASLRFARWMRESLGVKAGDRILFFAQNCPEWVVADLGTATACAVSVPIHRSFSTNQIVDIAYETSPVAVFISRCNRAATELILEFSGLAIPIVELEDLADLLSEVAGPRDADEHPSPSSASLASIIYTSGTTSSPRGVRLLHGNFCANAASFARAIPIGPRDRFLSILPISHVFERVVGLYVPLLCGASVLYPDPSEKKSPDQLFGTGSTMLLAVPRMLEKIAAWGESSLDRFSSLETIIAGGAPVSRALEARIAALGIELLQGYGLTETGPVISVNRRGHAKQGSVGLPLDSVEIRQSKDGVLEARGPSVTPGYLDGEEKDSFTEDGWFSTGDVVTIDKEGFVTIVGRTKDFIKLSTGEKIAPRPIEELLEDCPYFAQALVVGEGRKHIIAVLTLKDGEVLFKTGGIKTAEAQIRAALEHLPRTHQVRAYVLFSHPFNEETGELTSTGKPRRAFIEEKYATDIGDAYRNS